MVATLQDLRAAIARLFKLPNVPNLLKLNSNTRERAFECYVFALILSAIRKAGGESRAAWSAFGFQP